MAGASRFSINAVISLLDSFSSPMNKALGTVDSFNKKAQKGFSGTNMAAKNAGFSVGSIVKGIVGANLIQRGLGFIADGFKKIVTEAANYEMTLAGFTTLLGGNEAAAKKLVGQLQILGAETPFEFKDLANSTQMLLGFGAATKDNVIDKLRMLGDLSQGSAERLTRVARVYGQIMSGGIMKGQDFNQLIDAQVPIAQGLAKVWGVDVNSALKRVKNSGGIMASDVEKAMIQMTSVGGMFYQGMLRSSKTLTGLWSTFQDAISMTASGIGTELLPTLKEIVIEMTSGATSVLKWVQANKVLVGQTFKYIIDGIKFIVGAVWSLRYAILSLTIAYMIWKTLIIATKAAEFLSMLLAFRMEYVKLIAAQWGLNAAMLANPLTWLVLVFAAAVGWIIYLNSHITEMNRLFLELTSILDNPTVKKILGIVLGGGVTGFMMDVREQVSQGTQSQTAATREGQQLSAMGVIRPLSNTPIENLSPNTRGINNTNTTNGNLGITVSADKGSTAAVTQSGKMPNGMTLAYGRSN